MGKALLHRKESIVLTAIEIISQLGIQGLTTKEIAERQGISEGTIFRHFKSKNEIILAILGNFSIFDSDIMDSLRIRNLSFKDAIRYYITSYAEYYENYPQITSIGYIYDGLMYEPELAQKVIDILEIRSKFIKFLIEQGKVKGEIHVSTDSEGLMHIISGSFNSIMLKWRMNQYNFSLKEKALSVLNMILSVF